ncbi:MAG: Gfo/Idh/MocA family oxidoreductase [bacterium]|nr:Gfo/Idh/MocA family oxidoreductase [bacterium]
MKKIRAAVIGCGNISVMHLDSIVGLGQANLVGVCDINADKSHAAAEKYNSTAYTDYKEMFEQEKPDIVHLCLPHYLHTPVACDAFRAGINVLSEKPISINYDDAVKAVELAKQRNMLYGVIFQCRYNTPSILVKKRITDGKLGAVKCGRSVLTWYRSDNYYDNSDWKGTWDKEGGGVIIDQTIHSLDLANWFIDSTPVMVQSTLHNRNHKIMTVEDSAEGFIKYENGCTFGFYAMNNYLMDEPIEIRLACENGTVRLSYDEAIINYNDGTVEAVKNQPQKIVSYTGGKPYWGTQHAVQINQFYRAVEKIEPLEISGEEALKVQKIVCDIYNNNDMRDLYAGRV